MNVDPANRARLAQVLPIALLVAIGLPVALRLAARLDDRCASGFCVPSGQIVAMLVLTIGLGALAGLIAQGKQGLVGVGVGSVIGAWAIGMSRPADDPVPILLIASIAFVPLAVGYAATWAFFRSIRD